jgi:hypothetical protein
MAGQGHPWKMRQWNDETGEEPEKEKDEPCL